ncbi:hypothetical protein ACFSO7_08130 [Bacillus sp. CGMCC 1.16607]|uniref:hypothetical protein n=1 Tax=Bacillus sp. CGMCC 1.16607 TaxID=3351842 RepID=UPI00362813BC
MKDFHCCASCEHFRVDKGQSGVRYHCSRLGYETNPKYRFHCWSPKENVKKLMDKDKGVLENDN